MANLASKAEKRVVFWHEDGMSSLVQIDATLALGMKARGHEPLFIVCSGEQELCTQRIDAFTPFDKWPARCATCYKDNYGILDRYGLRWMSLRAFHT